MEHLIQFIGFRNETKINQTTINYFILYVRSKEYPFTGDKRENDYK